MPTLKFTKQACRRIVEAGSVPGYMNRQNKRRPTAGHRPNESHRSGHLLAVLTADFIQNAARNNVVLCQAGTRNLTCHSPLSRPGDVLLQGKQVLIQWNPGTARYEIINAECDD